MCISIFFVKHLYHKSCVTLQITFCNNFIFNLCFLVAFIKMFGYNKIFTINHSILELVVRVQNWKLKCKKCFPFVFMYSNDLENGWLVWYSLRVLELKSVCLFVTDLPSVSAVPLQKQTTNCQRLAVQWARPSSPPTPRKPPLHPSPGAQPANTPPRTRQPVIKWSQ